MSYKSYRKSPSRPFDHLYDQNFRCSNRLIQKLNARALLKSAPHHLFLSYNYMFSDHQRNFYLPQRNPLPIEKCDNCCERRVFCNLNLLRNSAVNCIGEEFNEIKLRNFESPLKIYRATSSQTQFRESETQTTAYLPEGVLRKGETCMPEILHVSVGHNEVTAEDINKIERTRDRRQWEENLRYSSISTEDKLKQLKIVEWEEFLYREKEMNEQQNERLKMVTDALEERQNANEEISAEILKKMQMKNKEETQRKKFKVQLKFQRKMRKISRIYGKFVVEEKEESVRKINKNMREIEDYCIPNGYVDGDWSIEVKKFLSRKNPIEEKLREACDVLLASRNKKKPLKCLVKKKIEKSENELTEDTEAIEIEEALILIQSGIKGRAIQLKMTKEIQNNKKNILKNRAKFPLKKFNYFPLRKVESKTQIIEDNKKIMKIYINEAQTVINEAINYTELKVKESLHKKLLREAEELRKQRREIAKLREVEENSKRELSASIKSLIDEHHKQLTDEIMKKIVPVVIEIMAEREAQEFIQKAAANIDESENNVEKLLAEVLVPQIEREVNATNDELTALLASQDALEDFLNDFF